MEAPPRPARAVSVLGHPVSGLAPIVFLSAGWILLATQVLPRLRDLVGATEAGVELLALGSLQALPAELLMLGSFSLGSLLIGIVLFVIWIRSAGGFGPLSDRLLSRVELLAGLVLLPVGVLTIALLSRGDPVAGEARMNIACGWLWHEFLRAGTYPLWTDLWHGGYPGCQHSPSLPHLLQALIGFLRFDPFTAAKQLAWFCRMAGAVGFALFCARVHRDHRSGLLGGILYGLAPSFHAAWVWDGRLPGALVLAILPWGFLAAERLATGIGSIRSGAALALAIGALTMSDVGLARVALVLIGVFMLLRVVPAVATRGARAPSIPGVLIGVLGGVALAAGFVVPMIRDANLLNGAVSRDLISFAYRFPEAATVGALFRWNPTGENYLGLSIALLALLGIVRAVLDRWEGGGGIGPIPLVVMLLLPWFLAPVLSPGRDLLFVGGALAAAGIGRRPAAPRIGWIRRRGIYPVAMLLVLIDLAPISLATSFEQGREERDRIYPALRDRLPSSRFLELPIDEQGRIRSSYDRYAAVDPVPSLGGPSAQGAPRAFLYQAAMIDTLARVLDRGGPLGADLVDLLALQNVGVVLLAGRTGLVRPPDPGQEGVVLVPEIPALRIEEAAPVAILDPGLPQAPEPGPTALAEGGLPVEVSRRLARAQLEWIAAARPRTVREARAVVLPNRMEIELPDLGPVEIRIARNDYPTAEVQVDGRPWPWRAGPLGGIALVLEAGPHRIEIRETEEPLRRWFRIGQWTLAGLLFLVAVGSRRH